MTKRLMAACKSTTDMKTPRFNRRLVSLAKKPSTALSQDAAFKAGVKPTQIARQFGLSRADVQNVLARD